MNEDSILRISEKIKESKNIAVTSHLRPDGDSVCTSLALYLMGKQMNKNFSIFIKDPIPFPFNNFPRTEVVDRGQIDPKKFDMVILLECANVMRSGQKHIDDCYKINIDHHHSNDFYADINWVNPEAAAVACMIYKLGKKLNIKFDSNIATMLYSAIVSDTGSFQFSNTKANAFKTCYELVNYGAVPQQVTEMIFNNNPPEKIILLGKVLSTLKMSHHGKIATITMFLKFLKKLNLKQIDTEDITTCTRSIKGVKVVLFFKEIKKGMFRVSVRTKGNANAMKIAEHFSGGGHMHAAGFTVTGDYKKLIKKIPTTVNRILDSEELNNKESQE
jgi:bifunctional oligoribonuclease and PAP phosphatase NrnA